MQSSSITRLTLAPSLLALIPLAVFANTAAEPNYDEIARRVVTTSAAIKPGEAVIIQGGKHLIPLMEALAIEARKAGAEVTTILESDKVLRFRNVELSEEYLEQEPRFEAEMLRHADVLISLPPVSDFKAVTADVSRARFMKMNKADQFLEDMLDSTKLRQVNITIPTKERAAGFGLDADLYMKMVWDAVNADYAQISEKGDALKKILQGAKTVKLTSPSGTDLSFELGDRPVFVQGGVISPELAKSQRFLDRVAGLPSGQVFVAPVETSAEGKVVVPFTVGCVFEKLINISFEFDDGKLEDFKAEQGGKCFEDFMAASTGPKDMFASFSIGLNPALKVQLDASTNYQPATAGGLVYVVIGDNQQLGGSNKTESSFSFPIVNATVEVDGKVVVKDGQVVL